MSARPCDDVAVIVRAPARADPIAALIAECSDSTSTSSPCASPSATNFAKPWMIGVCGVIGYTGTTSGSTWRIACATASPPVRAALQRSAPSGTISIASVGHISAQISQPLQTSRSKPANVVPVEHDRRVGAVEPAEQAVRRSGRGRPRA